MHVVRIYLDIEKLCKKLSKLNCIIFPIFEFCVQLQMHVVFVVHFKAFLYVIDYPKNRKSMHELEKIVLYSCRFMVIKM